MGIVQGKRPVKLIREIYILAKNICKHILIEILIKKGKVQKVKT